MYLVTGVTGNVGREVAAQLVERGDEVRVFTRDARKASFAADRVHVAEGDYSDPPTSVRAAAGCEAVYLMTGRPDPATFRRLMSATTSRALPRVVFQSTTWASPALRVKEVP